MPESIQPIPLDPSRVNVLRGKSVVLPTGEDVRELCRMLDWCEERLAAITQAAEEIIEQFDDIDDWSGKGETDRVFPWYEIEPLDVAIHSKSRHTFRCPHGIPERIECSQCEREAKDDRELNSR